MTGDELKDARNRLGLSLAELAHALRMGRDGPRAIRRYETGNAPVTGPISVAVEGMLRERGL